MKFGEAFGFLLSERHTLWKTVVITALILVFSPPHSVCEAQQRQKKPSQTNDTLSYSQRFGVRTNAVGWLLQLPNLGMEFDLNKRDYGKWTLGVDGMWNWHTKQSFEPSLVYDLATGTLEVRRYFRTKMGGRVAAVGGSDEEGGGRAEPFSLIKWFKELLSIERPKARVYRAYYVGNYAEAGKYSFKFGPTGYQGSFYALGLSGGWGVPLHTYKNHSVDVEFGMRLGVALAKSDAYTFDEESNCYPADHAHDKDWHVMPALSDVHVSFVYRYNTIRNKYRKPNYARQSYIQERDLQDRLRADSIQHVRDSIVQVKVDKVAERKRLLEQHRDSVKQERAKQRELKQADRERRKAASEEKKNLTSDERRQELEAIKQERKAGKARRKEQQP